MTNWWSYHIIPLLLSQLFVAQAQFTCSGCPPGIAGVISNCADAKVADPTLVTGLYDVEVRPGCCLRVYCDMDVFGGGWTVFQKHFDGSVDFNRDFADYEAGFGVPGGNHWLGLANMRYLSSATPMELLVVLEEGVNVCRYQAHYSAFSLGPSPTYTLGVGAFLAGEVDDYLGPRHNGAAFTVAIGTVQTSACATKFPGGWWFNGCHEAQLNGAWYDHNCIADYALGLQWKKFDYYISFRSSQMMLRPPGFALHDPGAHDFCGVPIAPVCTVFPGPSILRWDYHISFRSSQMMLRPPGFALHDPGAHDFCGVPIAPVCTVFTTAPDN